MTDQWIVNWLLMAIIVLLTVWVGLIARRVNRMYRGEMAARVRGEIVLDEATDTVRESLPYDGAVAGPSDVCRWSPDDRHERSAAGPWCKHCECGMPS